MPAAPDLPTSITPDVTDTHDVDSETVHAIMVEIYKATIGATRTGNFTLVQADSGEVIPIDAATTPAVTVPVLEAGTSLELVAIGAGLFTLSVSGTTLKVPADSAAAPRAQNSSISLLWLTSTSVLVGGDMAAA